MKLIRVRPQGFCSGVIRAMDIINEALLNPDLKRPFYMLGSLVHNQHIMQSYYAKGVLLAQSLNDISEGTVIITAHGTSQQMINAIYEKKLDLLDATCRDVAVIHHLIQDKITLGFDVIFYGQANHPETKGVMGINGRIHLIQSIEDIPHLNISNPMIAFVSQTTMSSIDVSELSEAIKVRFPEALIIAQVCNATSRRQEALIEAAQQADLCIVVGDPMSNNTNKLKYVCEKYTKTPCILIENVTHLAQFDLTPYETIAISSGASTPTKIVDEVISGIENHDYQSYLTLDDYLKRK